MHFRVSIPNRAFFCSYEGSDPHKRIKLSRDKMPESLREGYLTGHARLKLYTQSCRLEMYLSEALWLKLSRSELQLSRSKSPRGHV